MKPIYTLLLVTLLMAHPGAAQSTPDQKPAAPDTTAAPATPPAPDTTAAPDKTATPDNTAAPEKTGKLHVLHKLNPIHKRNKTAKAEKPAKPEKAAKAEKAKTENPEAPGPTAFVQLEGSHFNMGTVLTYDFDFGYKFNEHVSADFGIPIYSTRTPFPLIKTTDWRDTTILGAPYIDVRYDTKRGDTNITSILTGSAGPNMVKTYSNGRMTVDWFNHFDRNYQIMNYDAKFTPFLNFGAGTGTVDRQVMPRPYEVVRPYETLGYIGNGEVGGDFTVMKHYKLGGSAYGLAPFGPQKIYSRLVSPDSLLGGDGHHNRFWDEFFETGGEYVNTYGGGPSRIARDNGYAGWLEVTRWKNLSIEFAYTKSVHYDYGAAFIMVRFNLTGILRNLTTGE